MWLRLTAKSDNTPMLINMEDIRGIVLLNDNDTNLIPIKPNPKYQNFVVSESIDEIELMLAGKGAEVRRNDPQARSFIGSKPDALGDEY